MREVVGARGCTSFCGLVTDVQSFRYAMRKKEREVIMAMKCLFAVDHLHAHPKFRAVCRKQNLPEGIGLVPVMVKLLGPNKESAPALADRIMRKHPSHDALFQGQNALKNARDDHITCRLGLLNKYLWYHVMRCWRRAKCAAQS